MMKEAISLFLFQGMAFLLLPLRFLPYWQKIAAFIFKTLL
jgi:hypothetical protein